MKFLISFSTAMCTRYNPFEVHTHPHWVTQTAANVPSAYLLTIPIILITNTYFHLAIGPKMKIQFMSAETEWRNTRGIVMHITPTGR